VYNTIIHSGVWDTDILREVLQKCHTKQESCLIREFIPIKHFRLYYIELNVDEGWSKLIFWES